MLSIQSIQFWSGFIPVNRGGQIYPTLVAISPIPTLHLTRFNASSFKPTFLLFFSTCIFHVFLSCLQFLFPFTSNSNTFLKTCPSSLLNTYPYHLTSFAPFELVKNNYNELCTNHSNGYWQFTHVLASSYLHHCTTCYCTKIIIISMQQQSFICI